MTIRIDSKTTRDRLNTFKKADLQASCSERGVGFGDAKKMSKEDCVSYLMNQVAEMRLTEEAAAKEAEEIRLSLLARENEEGLVSAMLQAILGNLNGMNEEALKVTQKFMAEASRSPYCLGSEIAWHAENVLQAVATIGWVQGWQKYITDRIESKDQTSRQIRETIEDAMDNRMRGCMRDDFRSNSTSPGHNMETVAKFAAKQKETIWLRAIVKTMVKYIGGNCDVLDFGFCGRYEY
jgi:hypothetical protein